MSEQRVSRRAFFQRTGVATGGLVLGPGLLAACGGGDEASGDANEFKIGAVLELSGADSTGGQLAKRGYEFWVETINDKGGIPIGGKKYPVRMVTRDARSDPAAGADAATHLITQENVDVLFGSYTSGVQIAINPICAKYQMPCIAGSAESPETWKTEPQFTYGIIPAVDLTADEAMKFVVEAASPKPATAAVLGADEPFSKDAAAGFAEGAKAVGLRLTTNTLFPPDGDLTPIIGKVASQRPDILAVGAHDTILIDVVKACKSQNFTPKALLQHYGVTEPAFVQALREDAEGCLGLVDWDPSFPYEDKVFGTAKEYAKNYKDRFGVEVDYTGAGCSVAGEILQLALQKLGKAPHLSTANRVQLNKLLGQTNAQTFYGPIKFDTSGAHYHDNVLSPPVLVQIQDGAVVPVAPAKFAHSKLDYPLTSL